MPHNSTSQSESSPLVERGEAAPGTSGADVGQDENPFVGLVTYREQDQLFARDSDVEVIVSRMWAGRITVLFAGSGVGKSSFLNAKLIPSIRGRFGEDHVVVPDANSWARVEPDTVLSAACQQLRDAPPSRNGGIIVLDQFEEIFQHFPDPATLKPFGEVLSTIAEEGHGIRLLISIREEFLAQLTTLDDFAPGLLNNYYRLRKLSPRQARFVVEQTALQRGVKVGPQVSTLIGDLAQRGSGGLIDPPYLQVVCRRIWHREAPRTGAFFLGSYKAGEAETQLDQYCRDKLAQALTPIERNLVRRALTHLTGPHEAKKFARVADLAHQIGESTPEPLDAALSKLLSGARILRSWTEMIPGHVDAGGASGQVSRKVYQLYHDMYAPLLWRWKEEQDRRERTVTIAKYSCWIISGALALWLLVLSPALRWWIVARKDVADPTYASTDEFASMLETREAFSHSPLLRPVGDLLFRKYLDKLTMLAAFRGDSDAAMSFRLLALSASANVASHDSMRTVLGPSRHLLATEDLRPTRASAAAMLTVDGVRALYVGTYDGAILVRDRKGLDEFAPVARRQQTEANRVLAFSPTEPTALAFWTNRNDTAMAVGLIDIRSGRRVAGTEKWLSGSLTSGTTLSYSVSQLYGGIVGGFSADGRWLSVVVNGYALIRDSRADDEWHQLDLGRASSNPLRNATSLSFSGNRATVRWRREIDSVGSPESIATIDFLEESPTVREIPGCFLPYGSRLLLRPNGAVLARCDEAWYWIDPATRTCGSQPVPRDYASASMPLPADFGLPLGGRSWCEGIATAEPGSRVAAATQTNAPTVMPQAVDHGSGLMVSTDSAGHVFSSALGDERAVSAIVSTSKGDKAIGGLYPRQVAWISLASLPAALASGADSQGNAGYSEILTIEGQQGDMVRVWSVVPPPTTLAVRPEAAVGALPGPAVASTPACSDEGQTSFVSEDGRAEVQLTGSELRLVKPPGSSWNVPEGTHICGLRGATKDGARVLVAVKDGLRYGGSQARTLGAPASQSFYDVALGPGPDNISIITTDRQLRVIRVSDGRSIWNAECWGCRLLNSEHDAAVIVYSDHWIHRLTAPAERMQFSPWSLDHWPASFSSVLYDGVVSALKSSPDSSRTVIVFPGEVTLDVETEAQAQVIRSRRLRSLANPAAWFSPWTVTNQCNENVPTPDSWNARLCGWERRSRGYLASFDTPPK